METIFSNPKEYSKKISEIKSFKEGLKEKVKPSKEDVKKYESLRKQLVKSKAPASITRKVIKLKKGKEEIVSKYSSKTEWARKRQEEEEKKLGKLEKRRAEIAKKVKTALKKRVPHRTIIKKQDVRLTLPDIKRQNMWNDPNRFFKSEMEETKKSMFLR
jgi:hypothetical protein